ncbi:MAG: helix-turn-helix domain-containing protein [Minisyncoccia bacterium]
MEVNNEDLKNLTNLILEALKLKGLTIDKLSQMTGVSERSLALLLEERFDKLPPAPYVHGYLVKIAEVLNLDGQKLWQEYLKNNEEIRRSGQEDVLPPNRFAIPKINKKLAVGIAAVIIVLCYLAIRLPAVFGQPEITIQGLDNNPTVVQEASTTVHGIMNPADELKINGEAVYPDKDGNFQKNILLQSGFNNIVFQVKKLLGKTYTINKQVFYQTKENKNDGQIQ